MGLRLKNKMDDFFDSISDREKSINGKLCTQIKFLKKYLGTFGDLDVSNAQDELIQKCFHIQLRNDFGQGRY